MRLGVIIFSVLIALLLALSGIFDNEAMYGLIHADAQGYYGYLVAIFIEHSFDWDKVIQSYADVYFDGGGADFTVISELGRINKYYVGTSILMLPFFLISCVAALVFGFPVDGYSPPFQYGMLICALFYVGVGMYLLSKFLETKGMDRAISLFVVVFLFCATGLFHYSISEPAMSHAYSFALFCAFLYVVERFIASGERKYWWMSAAIFALIVLVRPANGLILFAVPFIAGGMAPIKKRLTEHFGMKMLIAALVVIGILSIQSIMYLLQVGKPLVWSYQGEGFNFLSPEIVNVLFSFQKGFFVYTPIAFLGTIGLVWMLIKQERGIAWLWAFLALSIYVISCWWNWYYGSSLGMRALIEYLPFFALGLVFLIQHVGRVMKVVLITLCLIFVSINLVQSYQYQKFILHWDGMNQDRYWQIFLQTDRQYDGIFYRQKPVLETPKEEEIVSRISFSSDFEEGTDWGDQGITSEMAFAGKRSSKITGDAPYGSTLGVPVKEFGVGGTKKLLITAMVWSEEAFPDLSIAYSYRNDSADYGHDYIGIGQLVSKPGEWTEVKHIATLHQPADTADNWIVYPYLSKSGTVFLDNVRYEVITLKE